jgi:hypothetical protein
MYPFALIFAAVGVVAYTNTVYFAILEMAGIFGSRRIEESPDAVFAVAGNALRRKRKRENEK